MFSALRKARGQAVGVWSKPPFFRSTVQKVYPHDELVFGNAGDATLESSYDDGKSSSSEGSEEDGTMTSNGVENMTLFGIIPVVSNRELMQRAPQEPFCATTDATTDAVAVTDISLTAASVVQSAIDAGIARKSTYSVVQYIKTTQAPLSYRCSQGPIIEKSPCGALNQASADVSDGSDNGSSLGLFPLIRDSSLGSSSRGSEFAQRTQESKKSLRPQTAPVDQPGMLMSSRCDTQKVWTPSPSRAKIMEIPSMIVTQDVGEMPEIDAPTSFEPSNCSVAGMLPPLGAMAEFQGAWELSDQDQTPDNWLMCFIITGRAYLGGDGSENYLGFREADASVLLEGGALSVDNGTLSRTGKSGKVLRFQHFELPAEDMVENLQGVWAIFDFIAGSHGWLPPAWLFDLTIQGRVWKAGEKGGILKHGEVGIVCMYDNYELWLENVDEKQLLFLAISEHNVLQYELRKSVPCPWW